MAWPGTATPAPRLRGLDGLGRPRVPGGPMRATRSSRRRRFDAEAAATILGRLSGEAGTRSGALAMTIVSVMADAGLRRSEAAGLEWRDVAPEGDGSGRALIRRSRTDQVRKLRMPLWRSRPPPCRRMVHHARGGPLHARRGVALPVDALGKIGGNTRVILKRHSEQVSFPCLYRMYSRECRLFCVYHPEVA